MDMKITYSAKVRWHRPVTNTPMDYYGKSNKARLRSTLNKLSEMPDISFSFAPLSEFFLDWFEPIYLNTISEKSNAMVHEVRANTIENTEINSPLFGLTLMENSQPTGGIIYSLREDMLAVHYRIFSNNWATETLQANPSLVSDYFLAEEAFKQNKLIFSHGLDRNPYGINSNIGLANFKLSVGCQPKLPKNAEFLEIDTDSVKQDALILHKPESGDLITEGTLVCTAETEQKYAQIRSFADRVKIETIYRD